MKKMQGFTIIEVTLVAMIAALIFLMVFLALPSMWANERDSERRTDVAYFINRLKNYQTNNNRGALPSGESANITTTDIDKPDFFKCPSDSGNDWKSFYRCYFNESFMDPSGAWYELVIGPCKKIDGSKNTTTASDCYYGNKKYEDYLLNNGQDYTLHVITEATCDGSQAVKSANTRNVAVLYRLERGAVYCENT